jgi:hypothetical protein
MSTAPVIHTESGEEIRVISFRRATTREIEILFASIESQLPPPARYESRPRHPSIAEASITIDPRSAAPPH